MKIALKFRAHSISLFISWVYWFHSTWCHLSRASNFLISDLISSGIFIYSPFHWTRFAFKVFGWKFLQLNLKLPVFSYCICSCTNRERWTDKHQKQPELGLNKDFFSIFNRNIWNWEQNLSGCFSAIISYKSEIFILIKSMTVMSFTGCCCCCCSCTRIQFDLDRWYSIKPLPLTSLCKLIKPADICLLFFLQSSREFSSLQKCHYS